MEDIILELLRVIVTGAIFAMLLRIHLRENYKNIPGWRCILIGFSLLFIGNIFDFTDNFESLNRFIIIGDTPAEAFIEKFIGFLLGFVFLFIGLRKWLPIVVHLEKAKNKAEEVSKAKSDFLANMSHELRTPLHGILSYAKLGSEKCQGQELDKIPTYFDNISISGNRLLYLLDELLDLSKLSSGKIILDTEPASLYEISQLVITEYQALLEDKKLHINAPIPSIETTATVDKIRMEQVIRNLLSNAIKFTPEGKEISILFDRTENQLNMYVTDEGVGIPENELDHVFGEFMQSSKTKTGAGGTGLGLAICKKLVEKHQGTISVKNNADEGCTFTVSLPV